MDKRILKHSFSLLNADCVKLDHNWDYSNIISPYYRLYYIDEGEGWLSNEKQKEKLEPGYIYLIPSFTLCNFKCPSTLNQYFIQFFEENISGIHLFGNNRSVMKIPATDRDIQNFKRLLEINPGRGINRSYNPKIYEKNVFYKEYQELNNLLSLSAFMETQGIILQLVSRFLAPEIFQTTAVENIPSKILDTISFIQLNLHEDINIVDLANRVYLHPDYFSRLFKKSTGISPIEFINEKRIERAQYLITTTNLTLDRITKEIGFENMPYFSRMFKKITGLSPGFYRNQQREFKDYK